MFLSHPCMKNIFRKLHLWLSVPFGLVIVVTCFTGAMLVFEKEITALCCRDMAIVEPIDEPLSIDVLAEKVTATMPSGTEISGVTVTEEKEEAWIVNISEPRSATLYVNQYTGEVLGEKERLPFFQTVLRLHRWLLDTRPADGGVYWGKMVVGTSTIAFVVILLSGLILWWPRNRKMLKNRLQVVLKKGKNRFWYDLHVAGGFYALLFLLAMALTGLTWSFEWYRNGFYSVFGANDSPVAKTVTVENSPAVKFTSTKAADSAKSHAATDAVTTATASSWNSEGVTGATVTSSGRNESLYTAWNRAFDAVADKYPSYSQITVSAGEISVRLAGCGNQRASDKYMFDERSGELLSASLYENNSSQSKLRGWIYSIHVGSWGGTATRVLAFLAALLGAALPLTGYYFWIRKLYYKKKNN